MMKAQIVLHTSTFEPSAVNNIPVQWHNGHKSSVWVYVERIFCKHFVAPLAGYYQAVLCMWREGSV